MSLAAAVPLFTEQGSVKVQIKFKGFGRTDIEQMMSSSEISKLVCPDTGAFVSKMQLEDWPFEVYKYEINPQENTLVIRARKLQELEFD